MLVVDITRNFQSKVNLSANTKFLVIPTIDDPLQSMQHLLKQGSSKEHLHRSRQTYSKFKEHKTENLNTMLTSNKLIFRPTKSEFMINKSY